MTSCPSCGGAVDETDPVCGHCGASLNDRGRGEGSPVASNRPGDPSGRPARSRDQRSTGNAGRRPPGNAGTQGPSGARQSRANPPADEDRRDLVKFGIAAVGVAGVGWLMLRDDTEQQQTVPDAGSEVESAPQVGVSFSTDYEANELHVTIQSVARADSVTVDATPCAGVSEDVEFSPVEAGMTETISFDDGASCEVVVTATYEGNTQTIQKFDYDDA